MENTNQSIKKLMEILEGIDKTETETANGWWETSTGAEFGAEVKEKIIALFKDVLSYKVLAIIRANELLQIIKLN